MDIFLEKIVKRRKSYIDMLVSLLIVLATLAASLAALYFLSVVAPLLVAGLAYLGWFLLTRRNIEFEYAVTNGDLDIDIIINQRKRKRVFSGNCKDFEVVGRVNSDKYTKEIRSCKNVKDFSSFPNNPNAWFIYTRQPAPTVVLFEPKDQMIDSFATFIPRKVFRS